MEPKLSLGERVRLDADAAPWVIDSIVQLEKEIYKLTSYLDCEIEDLQNLWEFSDGSYLSLISSMIERHKQILENTDV